MPRSFSLAAVLAFRQQKEEAEERILAAIAGHAAQLRSAVSRVNHELGQLQEARAKDSQSLQRAADHQANAARWKALVDVRADLNAQLQALENRRREQQARYLGARSDREMLTELRQQQSAAWEAEMRTREQKRLDDLFNARRLRG